MSDNTNGCFKEAVCVEAMRIFDSCSDKDCLEDLEVTLSSQDQSIVENANFVKAKCVEVVNATFGIDPVPFNKGFFTVDITYTFKVDIDAYECASSCPETVTGTATFNKKVILYGSDGATKSFSSDDTGEPVSTGCGCFSSLPRATVSVVEPIILDAKVKCKYPFPPPKPCKPHCKPKKSEETTEEACEEKDCCEKHEKPECCTKSVFVTIGMFSIIQLSRAVPVVIPAYDYCIPEKQCTANTDSPCELFDRLKFPTNEFFPRGLEETEGSCGCSEDKNE